MKRILGIAILFCAAGAVAAQNAKPTPPPADDNDVVKISTNLIQLDVSVTDKKGRPIRDLRPDEIEIYENGKKQDISNFSFVAAQELEENGPVSTTTVKQPGKKPLILPSTPIKPEKIRRTIALVVDDLSLSFPSTHWVQEALRNYIRDKVQDGDLVAIIRTAGGVGALQQFTTDKRQLMAAADKVKFSTFGQGAIGNFEPLSPSVAQLAQGDPKSRDLSGDIALERQRQQEIANFRSTVFANGTLGAINFVIHGMEQLPGRKSIVLLSDGLRLFSRDERGLPMATSIMQPLRRLIEQANRASVVIYSIDARGLVFAMPEAQDDTSGMSSSQLASAIKGREDDLRDTQDGLRYLADETGGFAYINSNDIGKGLDRVIADQSYYLVGYVPDSDTFDVRRSRFNKLEVRVSREGAHVRYRSGFFGISDEQIAKNRLPAAAGIIQALTSPFAVNDIELKLHTLFVSDEKRQPFISSYIHINSEDLKFATQPDGSHKATFEIVAWTFGDNGVPVDQMARRFTITLQDDAYKKSQLRGIVYQYGFPVKKPGAYQYRVAISDPDTGKIGSASEFVEVPNLKKGRVTLSGVVLEAMSKQHWQAISSGASTAEIGNGTDPATDTSLREFRQGQVVRFAGEAYNVKPGEELTTRIRIFRDGVSIFEGQPNAVNTQSAPKVEFSGGLTLGADMTPGAYILQIIVSDAKGKEIGSQFVQYDVAGENSKEK